MTAAKLGWDQALAWRARRHRIDAERAPGLSAVDVASELCGLHAQLSASAELTAWARVASLEPDAVRRALDEERTLVKTWVMRGTLHLLPSDEYPLWQAAMSTVRPEQKGSWQKAFETSSEQLETLIGAIATVLEDRLVTREELAAEVVRVTGDDRMGERVRDSFGALIKPAARRGVLVFGPPDGQRVRFTRPDTWLPAVSLGGRDPDEAMREVVRRFLAVHGPATREDFDRWWFRTSPAQALKRIKALGDEVAEVDLGGDPAWMLARHVDEALGASWSDEVRLLPAFDQWVIASTRHAERLLPAGVERSVIHRPQGWVTPVVSVGGRFAGTWKHERRGARVAVEVTPFARREFPKAAVADEAGRLADHLGGELELSWVT